MNQRYLVSEHPQGTPEWLKVRAGKVTGSRVIDMLAKTAKGEFKATRGDYMFELAIERLTGEPTPPGYISPEMRWGTEQEPYARMAYEAMIGNMVDESGFFHFPDLPVGCSVDGIFETSDGQKGLIEIKCLKTIKHVKQMKLGGVSDEHIDQVIHNIWVTGADFCDYVLYDPRLPKEIQLYVYRYVPTPAVLQQHEANVHQFLREIDACVAEILQLGKKAA